MVVPWQKPDGYITNPPQDLDMIRELILRFQQKGAVLEEEQSILYKNIAKRYEGKFIVDAGCGVGIGSFILASYHCKTIGIDKNPNNIAFARNIYPGMEFITANLTTTDMSQIKADFIVCIEVLEHMSNPHQLLRAFVRSQTPCLFSTPNRKNASLNAVRPKNRSHVQEFAPKEIINMLAGTQVEILNPFNLEPLSANTRMTPLLYKIKV